MINATIRIEEFANSRLKKIIIQNKFLTVELLNYGARLYRIFTPDRTGKMENVLLSYDDPKAVLQDQSYFGATVGPVAGRIKNGDWNGYSLERNDGPNHCHGGSKGWSFQYFNLESIDTKTAEVRLTLLDTKSGYPGTLKVTVSYQLRGQKLIIKMIGSGTAKTLFNPTNHAYFNLSGSGKRDNLAQRITVANVGRLELDQHKIPTGNVLDGTIFNQSQSITEILSKYPQGLDDVFLLDKPNLQNSSVVLTDEMSGRQMQMATTNQSVVLFTTTGFYGNFQINGQPMHSNYGIAIEPQEVPDIVHLPQFGTIELNPETTITHETSYLFEMLK